MIRKGTVWLHIATGQTVEWCKDMWPGYPITILAVKIDGEHPRIGERVPQWMQTPNGTITTEPPPGVIVTQGAGT
jgi:hypothetical protein